MAEETGLSVKRFDSPLHAVQAKTGYGGTATGEDTRVITETKSRDRAVARNDIPKQCRLLPPEARAALRLHWKEAQEAAKEMMRSAEAQDGFALANSADRFDLALGKLWELRHDQDINWGTIVNHAQGMMKQFFLEKRVENLTGENCHAIMELAKSFLSPASKTTDDLTEVVRLIEDAGADPYGMISGDAPEVVSE
jgi:hypothetical protein